MNIFKTSNFYYLFVIIFIYIKFANSQNYGLPKNPAKNLVAVSQPMQSPINIETAALKPCSRNSMRASFFQGDLLVEEAGQNLKNPFPGSTLFVTNPLGKFLLYNSLQYHWHITSEHTINGQYSNMQLHIVHELNQYFNDPKTLAVVAILFQIGLPQSDIFQSVDAANNLIQINKNTIGTSLKTILGLNQTYYHYEGSLTTPNFDEVVNWYVLEEKQKISQETFDLLKQHINEGNPNNRVTQALNGRLVYKITPSCNLQSRFNFNNPILNF